MMKDTIFDVMVIGAGPAGVIAALRAGDLVQRLCLLLVIILVAWQLMMVL